MTDLHLIIPPEELVDKWVDEYNRAKVKHHNLVIYIAGKASKWSADAELDACVEWISKQDWTWTKAQLLAARRPKPLSETDQALAALEKQAARSVPSLRGNEDCEKIRRCLERLKKLEEERND